MKSLLLNFVFVLGYGCCVVAAFMVAIPLGLLTVGLPMVALSIYAQSQAVRK